MHYPEFYRLVCALNNPPNHPHTTLIFTITATLTFTELGALSQMTAYLYLKSNAFCSEVPTELQALSSGFTAGWQVTTGTSIGSECAPTALPTRVPSQGPTSTAVPTPVPTYGPSPVPTLTNVPTVVS